MLSSSDALLLSTSDIPPLLLLPLLLPLPQELLDTKTKFEMGLGESKFYHGLAKQAQALEVAGKQAHTGQLAARGVGCLVAQQQWLGLEPYLPCSLWGWPSNRPHRPLPCPSAAVGPHLEEMQAGLEGMQEHLGSDSPLLAAALR
jgi:hypothetical protein